MSHETLEAQLLRLPAEARARLAQVLLESLDGQPELDRTWLDEAERRAADLADGKVSSVPAAEALAEARRRLVA